MSERGNRLLEAALSYAGRGMAVFPVYEPAKDGLCSCGKACGRPGKHPRTPNGFKAATTDPTQIQKFWTDSSGANIGNILEADEVVIDVDPRSGGDKNLDKLVQRLGPLSATVTTETGGDGEHYRFRLPARMRLPKQLAPGVELKGCGTGYVLLPPSLHASGNLYEWARYCAPEEQIVAQLPKAWLQETCRLSELPGRAASRLPEEIPEGERNARLFSVGCWMRRTGATEDEILEALRALNGRRCRPPLEDEEVRDIAASAARYAPAHVPGQPAPRPASNPGADAPPQAHRQLQEPTADTSATETAACLGDTAKYLRQFLVLSKAQTDVEALWVLHTHLFEAGAVYATPYLAISSAVKGSGKSLNLEVLELLVARPWFTSRTTTANLVRKIDRDRPTVLLDETDAAFGGEKEYAETLRGVLNSGYRTGGKTSACVAVGNDYQSRDFETFCPKAFAGLKQLPDTVADRSIPISMKRKRADEKVESFRRRDVEPGATQLRKRLEACALRVSAHIRDARPKPPKELTNRSAEVSEILLAIGEAAGENWPVRARRALVELMADRTRDDSIGELILRDCRTVFNAIPEDRIGSLALCQALASEEGSPWAEWSKGRPLSQTGLARLLRPFGITPGPIRLMGGENLKGYRREAFEDAWARCLPPSPVGGGQTVTASQPAPVLNASGVEASSAPPNVTAVEPQESDPAGCEKGEILNNDSPCDGVTVDTRCAGVAGGGNGHEGYRWWAALRARLGPRAASEASKPAAPLFSQPELEVLQGAAPDHVETIGEAKQALGAEWTVERYRSANAASEAPEREPEK